MPYTKAEWPTSRAVGRRRILTLHWFHTGASAALEPSRYSMRPVIRRWPGSRTVFARVALRIDGHRDDLGLRALRRAHRPRAVWKLRPSAGRRPGSGRR